ncbi:hypothetical protein CTheo_7164 [Ceratobasidium theobromae]|uniref:Uncharacterized protein n=1 Tax=Ceratobasidium theobromae TaxID=1582974 RepID=A0A5N5QDJ2_9AGAM|nr:hypothetical protein CTheo_7164 [Ceratobasidium theobromae]
MPALNPVRSVQKQVAKESSENEKTHRRKRSGKKKRAKTEHFAQPKEQAGLLVTTDLDAAIQRCKNKVDTIAKQCRARNRRFRDLEFDLVDDLERCLHSLNTSDENRYNPADVLRVTEIFNKPKFFVDGVDAADIAQGTLGDCWFLSALGTITTMPQLIEKICVARDEQVGIYGFIFYRDSGWEEVIIDDYLLTCVPKWESISGREQTLYHGNKDKYNATARKGGKTLLFASCGDHEETWVPLIEKAYAKLYGDFGAISGGFTAEGIEDLTGGVSTMLEIADILDTDRFWREELMLANEDRLFGCSIKKDDASEDINGLMQAHAYSVVKAVEVNGKRFVRLRNPWGEKEWNGRWSDGSREWTPEWMALLPEIGHRFGNDGEFIMEYSDFLTTWSVIDRCRLFDKTWSMSSMWLEVMCRPFPCAWNYGDVSFTISTEEVTQAIIVLSRIDHRAFSYLTGCYVWALDFSVFRKGGENEEPLASSSQTGFWYRSVNLEIDLEPGEYVVHVRLDRDMNRTSNYLSENSEKLKPRKLARALTEQMQAKSIASTDFDPGLSHHMRIARGTYAAKDLTELEMIRLQPNPDLVQDDKHSEDDDSDKETAEGEDNKADKDKEAVAKGEGANKDDGAAKGDKATKAENAAEDDKAANDDEAGKDDEATKDDEAKKGDEAAKDEEHEDQTKDDKSDASTQDSESPSEPVHDRKCDGCGMLPIVGTLYHCMSTSCPDYDLCQGCMDAGKHNPSHTMAAIKDSSRSPHLSKTEDDSDNAITLGLRVYSKASKPIIGTAPGPRKNTSFGVRPLSEVIWLVTELERQAVSRIAPSRSLDSNIKRPFSVRYDGDIAPKLMHKTTYLHPMSTGRRSSPRNASTASQSHDSDEDMGVTTPGSAKENRPLSRNAQAQARLRARRKAYVESLEGNVKRLQTIVDAIALNPNRGSHTSSGSSPPQPALCPPALPTLAPPPDTPVLNSTINPQIPLDILVRQLQADNARLRRERDGLQVQVNALTSYISRGYTLPPNTTSTAPGTTSLSHGEPKVAQHGVEHGFSPSPGSDIEPEDRQSHETIQGDAYTHGQGDINNLFSFTDPNLAFWRLMGLQASAPSNLQIPGLFTPAASFESLANTNTTTDTSIISGLPGNTGPSVVFGNER